MPRHVSTISEIFCVFSRCAWIIFWTFLKVSGLSYSFYYFISGGSLYLWSCLNWLKSWGKLYGHLLLKSGPEVWEVSPQSPESCIWFKTSTRLFDSNFSIKDKYFHQNVILILNLGKISSNFTMKTLNNMSLFLCQNIQQGTKIWKNFNPLYPSQSHQKDIFYSF